MGLRDLILFFVVSGTSLRWIATAASGGPSMIVVWVLALLAFYIPLTLACLELSGRYPVDGGLYVWTREAFGEFSGFMAAWTYWTGNLPYYPAVLYFAAGTFLFVDPTFAGLSGDPLYFIGFACLALALITALNIVGLGAGKWLHNLGALGVWIPTALLVVMGFVTWGRFGSGTHFTPAAFAPTFDLRTITLFATLAFAFAGTEAAGMIIGEVKDPRRTMPRALLVAGLSVAATYIIGTLAALLLLPSDRLTQLGGVMEAMQAGMERFSVGAFVPIVAMLIVVAVVGAASAYFAACSRLPFAAGLDNVLPPIFGRLHPRWGTPVFGILIQAGLGLGFIVLGQAGSSVRTAYEVLIAIGITVYFIPYLYVFAGLIAAQRHPAPADAFTIPGGRPVATTLAVVGFVVTAAAIIIALIPAADDPAPALTLAKTVGATIGTVMIGVMIYRRRRADVPNAAGMAAS